jgi:DNA-binding MarR family transcriptional regulator
LPLNNKDKTVDLIDEILNDWKTQRPEIDCSGKATVCRIVQFYSRYIAMLEKALRPLNMAPNVFSVLVTIRRSGKHREVTIKKVMQQALITSGAMSNLLKRLVTQGLISKRPDDHDARSALLKLTPKGLEQINQAMEIQAACERNLTQALSKKENQQLTTLLKKTQAGELPYV